MASARRIPNNLPLINYAGVNTILFDYVVNYVFPQYALPWNNFYTNIDAEPYYQRNEQRNQNAVLAKVPIGVDAQPNLVIISGASLPIWPQTVNVSPSNCAIADTGNVLDTVATKTLLGKVYNQDCSGFDYQYVFNGLFGGVNPTISIGGIIPDTKWVIFQLNLLNISPKNKQSVIVVTDTSCQPQACSCDTPAAYSTLNGSITINRTNTINIINPIPLTTPNDQIQAVITSGASNTVYGLYGNRIFIAILTSALSTPQSSVGYNFQFRICETPTLATQLNANATP